MDYKPISLSDENDNVVKGGTWREAYSGKYYIQGVQVWVFNKRNELFVQKRAKLRVYPYYYDVSASGHVDYGEDYREAGAREVREELGINVKEEELIPIMKLKLTRRRFLRRPIKMFMMLFIMRYDEKKHGVIRVNKEEALWGRFMSIEEIKHRIKKGEKFMPSFKRFFKLYFG